MISSRTTLGGLRRHAFPEALRAFRTQNPKKRRDMMEWIIGFVAAAVFEFVKLVGPILRRLGLPEAKHDPI
jgi:hypothetical protein